ncbi:ATPase AAA domain-containing protein 2B [Dissophora globulifera]|uniref:ATPase AAA domain-containing protein 2B n=1 Tax=Dissophora globulifera TaxID=979702 RepID=A0A9P6RXG7_9FUNG|nr:ATPase AAA domain-containing protein 2B [Dissophora globulifera]
MVRNVSSPLNHHNYSDNDPNDSKRRRIQNEDSLLALSAADSASISNGNAIDPSLKSIAPASSVSVSSRSLRTTVVAVTTRPSQPQAAESDSGPRSFELRRPAKRVNYAEEGDSEEEEEEEEEEELDDDDDEGRPTSPTRGRARPSTGQSALSSRRHAASDEEGDFEVKSEQKQDLLGPRTLRDRRSITAPKPFPDGNPPQARQPSHSMRFGNSRQNRSHFEDSRNIYRPISRSLPSKRPPPVVRPITENMRITRGMSGSLAPDSPNSRDVTPDRTSRLRGRTSSRFHHDAFSDDEQDLDGRDRRHDGGEEDDEEDMEGEPADDEQTPSLNNPDDNGLIRMTRLRARVQAQPPTNSRHTSQRPSRSKPSHQESQQEADRKYDLRERPKNRPTYIADRPVQSPSRPRTSRMFSGSNPFSRPRQGRSSLLEALARAGGSSSDEQGVPNFKRRSGTSESRGSSSRILPMNMHELAESRRDVIASRAGQLADTDPLAVGNTVDFDKVGGLDHHIKSLKEMVILPLLYPEVYSHFQMMPPRGVLFHGPPGTGKTLLARALASSCSTETQKVAFFMRKGADCLSKWVGEAERQLRLLFEEAKAWQPSIIFFDEIDGLCPVRSSKQEQIHASIVSTMLALMDGLDGRGQVIVIGATNRIDAIDPALRRPGRFDREFYFPLPNEAARRTIIDINTSGWVPPLDEKFKGELARMTTRYCGADIKALCTEAALRAIRRRYPQIYESNDKLQIDASTIVVDEVDMLKSAKALTPASYRVTGATASPLPENVKPLLQDQFDTICRAVDTLFSGTSKRTSKGGNNEDDDASFQAMGYRSFEKLKTFRPRMIITGQRGMGQRYIGPALLHYLEGCTVQQFDLAALMSESSRTPEAACVQYFIEVKRHAPSVIYIPHIDVWWSVVSDAVKATFSNLLEDLSPEDGILFLATSETPLAKLPITVKRWFLSSAKGRVELSYPESEKRELFFQSLIQDLSRPPTDFKVQKAAKVVLEPLKKAPPPQPRVPTAEEKKLLIEHDQYILREFRISLRTIVDELYKERKFKPFFRPVEPEESVDYYQVVKKPMDLATISERINDRMYLEVKEFLGDIDLIVENTTLYYDIQDPSRIIHRARDLQDVAHAMVGRLDPELITETEKTAARFRQEVKAQQRTQGERMSRRRLGLEAEAVLDDPEVLLRSRAVLAAKLATTAAADSAPEGSLDVSVTMEDVGQSEQQQDEGLESSTNAAIASALTKADRHGDDGEDSGTSLSLAPPHTTSSVIGMTVASDTVGGGLSPAVSVAGMDVDSPPKHSADVIEVAVVSGPVANGTTGADTVMDIESDLGAADASRGSTPVPTTTVRVAVASSVNGDTVHDAAGVETTALPDAGQLPEQEEPSLELEVEEEPKELVLERSDVELLQQALVSDTEGSSIEELDQLRAALYTDIWEHRFDWDKRALLRDMQETLESVTGLHREYRASEQKAVESFIDGFQ